MGGQIFSLPLLVAIITAFYGIIFSYLKQQRVNFPAWKELPRLFSELFSRQHFYHTMLLVLCGATALSGEGLVGWWKVRKQCCSLQGSCSGFLTSGQWPSCQDGCAASSPSWWRGRGGGASWLLMLLMWSVKFKLSINTTNKTSQEDPLDLPAHEQEVHKT